MRVVFVDTIGGLLDLVMTAEEAGHETIWYIQDPKQRDVGEGLVDAKRVTSWLPQVPKADLIVMGDSCFGKVSEALKAKGRLVVGGTIGTDKLESDRGFATDVARGAGIKVPKGETFKFTEIDKAIKYVKKHERLVLKPSYHDAPRWATHIAEDADDMIAFLEFLRTDKPEKVGNSFLLQDYVDGVEVACGGWFNGHKWVKPFFANFEIKGFMNNDLGPRIDSGAIGKYFGRTRLFTETLQKLTVYLKANTYIGYFDMNMIVNESGTWLLEFTPRFGYPTIQLQNELQREDWISFMYRLASGAVSNVKVMSRWGCSLSVSTLPAPLELPIEDFKGMPVLFPGSLEHIHLYHIKKRNEFFVTAGTSGAVCEATGHANTLGEAIKRAYQVVDTIKVPALMYRTDIEEIFIEKAEQLKGMGYL